MAEAEAEAEAETAAAARAVGLWNRPIGYMRIAKMSLPFIGAKERRAVRGQERVFHFHRSIARFHESNPRSHVSNPRN